MAKKRLTTTLLMESHAAYPANGVCKMGSCPSVHTTDRGSFLLVGHWLPIDEKAGLSMDKVEDVVEIPEESMIEFAKAILAAK